MNVSIIQNRTGDSAQERFRARALIARGTAGRPSVMSWVWVKRASLSYSLSRYSG
jgi:hypothetical protein